MKGALQRKLGPARQKLVQSVRVFVWLLAVRALRALYLRRRSIALPAPLALKRRPFMAFSGSGLLLAYFHGVVTYIRDHFYTDNLRLSGISGGCSTILALAMGIDLYQILLMGLHIKKRFLGEGLYLKDFRATSAYIEELFQAIGITDEDVAQLSDRQQCFIGVTQCCPPGHCCMPMPRTRRELVALWLSSMNVVPFFRTPGIVQGKYCVDGGFSAVYSVPSDQPWDEVIKVTCFPWYLTLFPPAMGIADIQPSRLMLTEVVLLYPWAHQRVLIKRGYDDAKRAHGRLVARGLRPRQDAPLTPWSEWERLLSAVDEDNLPPLSAQRSTAAVSEAERRHAELLRTFSASDLRDALHGPRVRRLNSSELCSRSETNVAGLPAKTGAAWAHAA
mmetsp:Transcript_86316/g.252566  ORF Transcript_86316/g.252566 Transcript_86316/m.252566 type:complete len:390 (+) Transcript_86316:44-1213(+)